MRSCAAVEGERAESEASTTPSRGDHRACGAARRCDYLGADGARLRSLAHGTADEGHFRPQHGVTHGLYTDFKPSSTAVHAQMIAPPLSRILNHRFREARERAPSPLASAVSARVRSHGRGAGGPAKARRRRALTRLRLQAQQHPERRVSRILHHRFREARERAPSSSSHLRGCGAGEPSTARRRRVPPRRGQQAQQHPERRGDGRERQHGAQGQALGHHGGRARNICDRVYVILNAFLRNAALIHNHDRLRAM